MSEPITNPAPVANDPAPVKTFTQDEVDSIVGRKLAKVMKGMPDEKELKLLKEEGKLVPVCSYVSNGSPIKLELTANSTHLVLIR